MKLVERVEWLIVRAMLLLLVFSVLLSTVSLGWTLVQSIIALCNKVVTLDVQRSARGSLAGLSGVVAGFVGRVFCVYQKTAFG